MSLRKFMHPRNKYKIPPKFKDLAALYPEFKQHIITGLTGKLQFNFKNEESLRVLAKTLLKHDFHLEVEIPHEKLVPALPLRLNYILWIEDLMKHSKINKITGIDIGTGAVCIYPVLCAKVNGWKMIATEIDPSSVTSAMENVRNNCLDQLINVISVNKKYILKDIVTDDNTYSFTMCNPPFFNLDKSDEIKKSSPPRNAKTGNKIELTVDGGEYSFVSKIIDESTELVNKIQIYTTMIGLKNNLSKCLSELKRRNIENLTWTEFCQGHTKRWGLAWSFCSKKQFDLTTAPVIRTKMYSNKNNLKNNNVTELIVPLTEKFPNVHRTIDQLKLWIHELKIEIKELTFINDKFDGWTYELCANEDTWSHARRKRRMLMQKEQNKIKKICIEGDTDSKQDIIMITSSSGHSHVSNEKKPYLILDLAIEKLNFSINESNSTSTNQKIKIFMIYHSGYGGKNALETFKQYLINKFDIREYIQQIQKTKCNRL